MFPYFIQSLHRVTAPTLSKSKITVCVIVLEFVCYPRYFHRFLSCYLHRLKSRTIYTPNNWMVALNNISIWFVNYCRFRMRQARLRYPSSTLRMMLMNQLMIPMRISWTKDRDDTIDDIRGNVKIAVHERKFLATIHSSFYLPLPDYRWWIEKKMPNWNS